MTTQPSPSPQQHDDPNLVPSNHMNIKEVRRTANDALLSKLSASIRGYFHDDFLQYYSFPVISEYLPLMLPNFTTQHQHIIETGTLPYESSPYNIVNEPPTFQNTPYSPLPTSFQSTTFPTRPNPLLSSHTSSKLSNNSQPISPLQQSNLDLTFPKPLSNHSPSSPAVTPIPSSPQQNISAHNVRQSPHQYISQLPPSVLPALPSIVPKHLLPRRSPLINKGYACRVHALDKIIVDFIQTCQQRGQKSQILSIGAGYDSTYFRLKYHHNIKATQYVELDFPHTIAHKANLIHHPQNTPLLNVINSYSPDQYKIEQSNNNNKDDDNKAAKMYTTFLCPSNKESNAIVIDGDNNNDNSPTAVGTTPSNISSPQQSALYTPTPSQYEQSQQQNTPFALSYHDFSLIGCDGRDVVSLQKCLEKTLWDPNYPTLMLFECVLVYIPPSAANDMLQTLTRMHKNITMITVYEQMHPNDPFGRTMMRNLHERGCPLLSLPTYPDLQHQLQRFKNFGYQTFTGWSLAQIAQHFTPCPGVEVLDEMEEYQLMSSHYTVFIGLKDPNQKDEVASESQEKELIENKKQENKKEENNTIKPEQDNTTVESNDKTNNSSNAVTNVPENVTEGSVVVQNDVKNENKKFSLSAQKPQSQQQRQLSPQQAITSQLKQDPYANLHVYSRQHGENGGNGAILHVPGSDNIKCSGDYDWCTSILDPVPYKYTPNYHPSQLDGKNNNNKDKNETTPTTTTTDAKSTTTLATFDKIGFMGCFPPSYQLRAQVKRNGKQLIVD